MISKKFPGVMPSDPGYNFLKREEKEKTREREARGPQSV
jgi:hypothetical protein